MFNRVKPDGRPRHRLIFVPVPSFSSLRSSSLSGSPLSSSNFGAAWLCSRFSNEPELVRMNWLKSVKSGACSPDAGQTWKDVSCVPETQPSNEKPTICDSAD